MNSIDSRTAKTAIRTTSAPYISDLSQTFSRITTRRSPDLCCAIWTRIQREGEEDDLVGVDHAFAGECEPPMRQHVDDLFGRTGPKQNPADESEHEHESHLQGRLRENEHVEPYRTDRLHVARFRGVNLEWPVYREYHTMEEAPEDKIPRRAVPEPPEQHSEDEVAVRVEPTIPIPAERDVQIIAHTMRRGRCAICSRSRMGSSRSRAGGN